MQNRISEFERIEIRGSLLGSLIMYYQKLGEFSGWQMERSVECQCWWDTREVGPWCMPLVKGVPTPRSGARVATVSVAAALSNTRQVASLQVNAC